ncbi:MAG: efflux RND transporter periplasmic adaptor subunit [Methylocystaceae bacterium]
MKIASLGKPFQKFWGWYKGLKWYKWIIVAIIILIPLGISLGHANKSSGQVAAGVLTEKVQQRWVERLVATSGRLEPASKQEFFAPEDSTLMELSVEVGDAVKAGQVLGRLDTGELARKYESSRAQAAEIEANLAKVTVGSDQLSLEAAQARYQELINKMQRLTELAKSGAVTQAELDSVKSEYAQAKASYEEARTRSRQQTGSKEAAALQAQLNLARQEVTLAQERLQMGTFIAKTDGVVLEVGAEKGARVASGTRILTVGSRGELEVTCKVGEVDAGNLQPGQKVKITCTAIAGKNFTGQVVRVADAAILSASSQGSEVARVPVTLRLDRQQTDLKPGYTVDMRIITQAGKRALAIPFDAVVTRKGQKIVFVVDAKGMVSERKIATVEGNEVYDIVTSGLKAGDEVAVSPPPNLKAGMRVIRGGAR